MENYLYLGLGGFIGTAGRYFVSSQILKLAGRFYFLGTLSVNLIGSFVIGFLAALFLRPGYLHPGFRLFFITGCLGGFTTFSSFSLESVKLLQEGRGFEAILYILCSLAGGLTATYLGWSLCQRIPQG